MLSKFIQSRKSAWSSYLDTCVFAYNTSRHVSTHFTPFQLMFGRCAVLPIDIDLWRASPEEVAVKFNLMEEPDAAKLAEERAMRLGEAKGNILAAQEKQKAAYDKKHAKPDCFQEGELVLKKDFTRKKRKGGKFGERFLGPYVIQKALPNGTYQLTSEDGKCVVRATGAHLKPYNKPSLSPSVHNEPSQDSLNVS